MWVDNWFNARIPSPQLLILYHKSTTPLFTRRRRHSIKVSLTTPIPADKKVHVELEDGGIENDRYA